jgi:hypothetical protein
MVIASDAGEKRKTQQYQLPNIFLAFHSTLGKLVLDICYSITSLWYSNHAIGD